MKSLISAFAFAAVMGIAGMATPAAAANTCVVVNDGYHDFGELQCTRVFPFWYTPVAYKNNGGGNYQYDTGSSEPDHYCPPGKIHEKPRWDKGPHKGPHKSYSKGPYKGPSKPPVRVVFAG